MARYETVHGRSAVLVRALLFVFGCALILIFASTATKTAGRWSPLAIGTSTDLATFALTLLFVRWDKLRLEDVGAAIGRQSTPRFALGFVIGLFLVAFQSIVIVLAGHIHWVRSPEVGIAPLLVALLTYLALACREELAFHGHPLFRLQQFFGIWPAQFAIALLFSIEHRIGGYSWMNTLTGPFVGSLLFGMAALATRGLALPIGLHAAWNFGQWMLGEKEFPGIWKPMVEPLHEERVGHAATIGYLIAFSLATLILWRLRHRQEATAEVVSR